MGVRCPAFIKYIYKSLGETVIAGLGYMGPFVQDRGVRVTVISGHGVCVEQ